MIAHTDKGNPLMILPIKQYGSKITDFIRANNFQTTKRDPPIPSGPKLEK